MNFGISRVAVASAMVLSVLTLGAPSAGAVSLDLNSVSYNIQPPDPTGLFNTSTANLSGGFQLTDPPSVGSVHRSPFELTAGNLPGVYNTPAVPYLYVPGTGGAANSATYDFTATGGISNFSIVWGSPDDYNTLGFYNLAGTLIRDFVLADLPSPDTPIAIGNILATFVADANETIGFVKLSSTKAAFEWVLYGTPGGGAGDVPLPPALILFGSALVGLTMLGRRRRAAKPVAA